MSTVMELENIKGPRELSPVLHAGTYLYRSLPTFLFSVLLQQYITRMDYPYNNKKHCNSNLNYNQMVRIIHVTCDCLGKLN